MIKNKDYEIMDQQYNFIRFIKKHIGEPNLIVEVGARDGGETKVFSKMFPASMIYSYECNPETVGLCEEACKPLPNVIFRPVGASFMNTSLPFHILEGDNGSSSVLKHLTEGSRQREVMVEMVRLRTDLPRQPDVLWLDTQGSEIDVMLGLGTMLSGVNMIHTEVYFKPAYDGQPSYEDIKNFLNTRGFYVHHFTSYTPSFGDAIFTKGYAPFRQWFQETTIVFISRAKYIFHIIFG